MRRRPAGPSPQKGEARHGPQRGRLGIYIGHINTKPLKKCRLTCKPLGLAQLLSHAGAAGNRWSPPLTPWKDGIYVSHLGLILLQCSTLPMGL